jgi:endoglucanase
VTEARTSSPTGNEKFTLSCAQRRAKLSGAGLCGPLGVWFSRADMKTLSKVVVASLFLVVVPQGACKPAPPKTAGAAASSGPGSGPAPAPLVGHNLVYNGDFAKGTRSLPWNGELSKPAEGRTFVSREGELCMEVKNRGNNRWDAQLRHQHLTLLKGHTYTVQFKVRSTQKTRAYLKLGQAGPPYREFWKLLFGLDEKPQVYSGTFTMDAPDDPGIEMAFHVGGQLARLTPAPFTVCLDDVRVDDPQHVEVPEPVPPPIPNVLVNQIGYFPSLAKIATVKNPNAVPWELLNAKGEVVAKGTTIPFGFDAASGDQVSIADFTAYAEKGTGYTLRVGKDVSHAFDIRDDLYAKLKYDALAFFYQQRSGIPIEMPYAGDRSGCDPGGPHRRQAELRRQRVPCRPAPAATTRWTSAAAGTTPATTANTSSTPASRCGRCSTGGSAAWRSAARPTSPTEDEHPREQEQGARSAGRGALGAGVRAARCRCRRGRSWRDGPPQDPRREVDGAVDGAARGSGAAFPVPVSTSATLDLAANAAQAARIWRTIDKAFADKCLKAAERAWVAAKANPEAFSPTVQDDGGRAVRRQQGGGQLLLGGAELYITTKKAEYKDVVVKSEFFKRADADWPTTACTRR